MFTCATRMQIKLWDIISSIVLLCQHTDVALEHRCTTRLACCFPCVCGQDWTVPWSQAEGRNAANLKQRFSVGDRL